MANNERRDVSAKASSEAGRIPKTSRAAVIVEYGKPLEIREYPIPNVEPGAILVRNEMAGLCGSDLHQWHGDQQSPGKLPQLPGHEFVGRIMELGQGVACDSAGQQLKLGDRIMWSHIECGECYFCRIAMQPTLCTSRNVYGRQCAEDQPHLMGGYAEYIYVLPGTQVIKVPNELRNEEVIGVCCGLRTAVAGFERAGAIDVQANVVILGTGPIGLYSLVLYKEGGAGQVILVGAPRDRTDFAKKWGADHTINIDEVPDPAKRLEMIRGWTGGRGADIVVEASGGPTAFPEGLEIVRNGGKFVLIGQVNPKVKNMISPSAINLKQIDVLGVRGALIPHYYRALKFIQNKRNKYSFADIVTKQFRLDEATEALKAAESGQVVKAVIVP